MKHGPQLPDPKKLLLGSGKQTRFVRLEAARQLAHPDVEALIVAAIDHARVPLPSKGKGRLIIRTPAAKNLFNLRVKRFRDLISISNVAHVNLTR